jgi:hypothetical protein
MSSLDWRVESLGRLRIAWAERPLVDEAALHPRERRWLDRFDARAERRADWTAGRIGLAQLLPRGAHVLSGADGAPEVRGADWLASISHEEGWVAVAARPTDDGGRIAIDLVPASAAAAARRALDRVDLGGDPSCPVIAWAALECAGKLRGCGVGPLLDRRFHLEDLGSEVRVHGFGRAARVSLLHLPGALVALADESPR